MDSALLHAGGNTIRNLPLSTFLQKYWFPLVLLLLTLVSFFSPETALAAAFLFTFLVPGLAFSRFFNLKSYEVWAFVPIISVLVSTQLTHYLSLVFGYSRETEDQRQIVR